MRPLALALTLACACRAALPPPRLPLVATPDAPARQRPPPLGEAPPVDAPAVEEATLASGLHLIVARNPGATVTEFAYASRRAGDESADLSPGLAYLSARLLDDALADPSLPDVAPLFVSTWVARESAGLYGNVHPAGLRAAVRSLYVALTQMPDAARFGRVRSAVADGLLRRVGDDAVLDHIASTAMYSDAIHARPTRGLSSEVCAVRHDHARAFLLQRYSPAESALVVVGRTTLAAVREAVEATLLGRPDDAPPPRPAAPAALRRDGYRMFLLEQRGTSQAAVLVSAPLRATTPRERVALELFDTMLGATPGSRLFRALRLERGASYGVSSALTRSLGASSLAVFGTVQQPRTAESVRAILAEIDSLRTTPAPAAEFERSRSLLRQRLREGLSPDGGASLAWSLAMSFVRDEPAGESARRALEVLASLTPEEVRRTVAGSLDPSLIRVAVRGDPDEVGDDLARLGLGAVGYFHREFGDSPCADR